MFVQIVQGRVKDAAAFKEHVDRWQRELAPGATGWLGSTGGVTDDGELIAVVRFESEAAAQANSDRPEQGAWFAEASKLFDGDPTFQNCREVDLIGAGGSDSAGFVQVIQGRTTDQDRLRALGAEAADSLARMRPDVLGALVAFHGDGGFTQTVYFTSEADARKGEAQDPMSQMSPEDQARFQEFGTLMQDARYLDLRDPWFGSAGG